MISIISLALMGCVLLFFEVFFPSGILALFSAMMLVASVWQGFTLFGPYWGAANFAIVALMAWLTVVIELQILPKTKMGKKVFLHDKIESQSNPVEDLKGLMGKVAVALTPLNLSGKVDVEGKTYEAQSVLGPVSVGSKVVVVDAGPHGLKVKEI